MTNNEAISRIKFLLNVGGSDGFTNADEEALNMAINALSAEIIKPPKTNGHDPVNHPSHYCQGGIECIDALAAATVNLKGIKAVCTANAIKYLWRWAEKNGVEDIDKAIWYLNRLREEVWKGE